jgi:hypothetical protein
MVTRPGPQLFYARSDFDGERCSLVHVDFTGADLKVIAATEREAASYTALLKTMGIERWGRLQGEFVYLAPNFLIDRDGCGVLINLNGEDPVATIQLFVMLDTDGMRGYINSLLDGWLTLPTFEGPSVIGEVYGTNFFHFMMLLIPKTRFFTSTQSILPSEYIALSFQKSLVSHIIGDRPTFPVSGPCRLIDPFLAQTSSLKDNVHWLRRRYPFKPAAGNKRYYITRGASSRNKGGGIDESESFLALLRDYDFTPISFGDGELTVEQQVQMLDGAGVVLTSHGAQSANLTFLQRPVSIIEILPKMTRHLNLSAPVELMTELGFRYRGLVSDGYTPEGRVAINCDLLRDILAEVC